MLTRRRFIGYSGAGMLALSGGCVPLEHSQTEKTDSLPTSLNPSIKAKADQSTRRQYFLGYPVNLCDPPAAFFDWRRELNKAGIGKFAYNNVGNPFQDSSVPFNTHDFESELILRFGQRFAFPSNNTWGFLSHSGTDSNMHGLYMGRTLLKGRTGVLPKAYFTREAHYSIQILRDLLGLETVLVDTLADGGMDAEDLRRKLADHTVNPALIVATVGTTFKGAVDRIDDIRQALKGINSYLHLDAALFGGYLPYSGHADEVHFQHSGVPRYDSIAVSCHKFFGFPSPAGLFITTEDHFSEFNELFSRIHNPEYIHHVPGTITCSRDAVKPAEFYYYSTPEASSQFTEDAQSLLNHTTYLMDQMRRHLPAWQPERCNELSNTVFFRKPSDRLVKKYSLATMHLEKYQRQLDYAHVVVMPHVNRIILDELLTDLSKDSPLSEFQG